jgi:hypothetical protein
VDFYMQLPCHGNSARDAPISGIGIAGFPARHVAPKQFDYLAQAAATGTTGKECAHAGRKKKPACIGG